MNRFHQTAGRFRYVGLLSLLLFSCSGASEYGGLVDAAPLYLPMHVGDVWEYGYLGSVPDGSGGSRPDTFRQQVRITGTEEHDGVEWFVVETAVPEMNLATRQLLRSGSDLLLSYRTAEGRIDTVADLGRIKVDSAAPEIEFVQEEIPSVELNGSIFKDCIKLGGGYVDTEIKICAAGIGVIESWWFRGRRWIMEATVDGDNVVSGGVPVQE